MDFLFEVSCGFCQFNSFLVKAKTVLKLSKTNIYIDIHNYLLTYLLQAAVSFLRS